MTTGSSDQPKPVVFLAFANEQEGKRYLREIPEEVRQLREVLKKAEDRGLCELEVRSNVTFPEIVAVFNDYGRPVAIFHYGGHAGPDSLLLESSEGAVREAHAEGLARFLGLQGGLQLVFLNGCSTGPQVTDLMKAGIDAVVATARPIDDAVAREFAVAFYTQLTIGRTFRDAFTVAGAQVKANHGGTPRDLIRVEPAFSTEDVADDLGFPWKLHLRDGAEAVGQESLPKLARQPLLGLPPLPPAERLPTIPFRHLQRFTREEAQVFFGRGQEIADLYALVTSPTARRVILYSGATGVGKSSVLDAGVLPRLAGIHDVVYLRRDAVAGLLGTLCAGLKPPGDGSVPASDLAAFWRTRETAEKPLVVVLDQAEEEAFTRPRSGMTPTEEVAELVRDLQVLFQAPAQSPRGRLILAFRKEWLQEFERAHDDARLGYESSRLGPLDHDGIVEAIEGPTLTDDLRRHYGLTIAPGLADSIAVELERDAGSALAPTLQVLLTKMWTAAGGKGASFTPELYDRLKDEGFLLNDVVEEGVKALKAWRPDMVDSGFALDLLEYHTTPFGTAETRSRADLLERYGHRADVLDECLRLCEDSYLLIPAETKLGAATSALSPEADAPGREPVPTRLGHDTLAPLVRERFRASMAPGQRARRLLENRASEWQDGASGTPLDRPDLETVERGLKGMRHPTKDEHHLIEASRQARDQQEKAEARNKTARRVALIAFAGLFLILAGVTVWAWRAQAAATRRTAEVLTQSGINALEKGHSFEAMHLFAQAVATLSSDTRAQADNRLRLSVLGRGRVPELRSVLEHTGEVNSAAFSPDGLRVVTASNDGTAGVWNAADGNVISNINHYFEQKYVSRSFAMGMSDAKTIPVKSRPAGAVVSAAFSPDGLRVVTASNGGTAGVWNAADRTLIAELEGHTGEVNSAAFSPDGLRVVTASNDGTARVWNAADGTRIAELKGHTLAVNSAAFSPDGSRLVTASNDRTAGVWNAADGTRIAELKGHTLAVNSAAFSPDGSRIVTASNDGTARVWNVADGTRIAELKGHTGEVNSAAFSPDGSRVVTASNDGTARVWNAADGTRIAELKGHTLAVNSAAFSPDESRVVTASNDRTARVWNAADGSLFAEMHGHTDFVLSAAFNPDGSRVVTASNDRTARVWNVADGSPITKIMRHPREVYVAAFSPNGSRVFTTSGDRIARVWNAADGKYIAELKGETGFGTFVAFNPDGSRVVTAPNDGTARVWNAADGTLIAKLRRNASVVNFAAFSPDGTRVVTASDDNAARVWRVSDRRLIAEHWHKDHVQSAAFNLDGSRVVTASFDQPAQVWRVSDNKVILELKGYDVHSARFSPDGSRVVTASIDGTARVWNAADGTLIAELKGHKDYVHSPEFSLDGSRVVTASNDGTARVWNAVDGTPIAELKGHTDLVSSAAFSPDGAWIVTASGDGTARVWPLEPLKGEAETIPLWVQAFTGTELQGGAIRPLSNAEWKAHCRKLRAYGTKAPPSPWLDGLNLAERPVRP